VATSPHDFKLMVQAAAKPVDDGPEATVESPAPPAYEPPSYEPAPAMTVEAPSAPPAPGLGDGGPSAPPPPSAPPHAASAITRIPTKASQVRVVRISTPISRAHTE
jgi:hypothetical protein